MSMSIILGVLTNRKFFFIMPRVRAEGSRLNFSVKELLLFCTQFMTAIALQSFSLD